MGGQREFKAPAKSTAAVDAGRVVGNLRIHENNGEVHFHDDQNQLKVAIPVAYMSAAWDRLSDGRKKKFNYKDATNGTELRMRIIDQKKAPVDLRVEVRRLKTSEISGLKSNDFKSFDSFIKGG